MTVQEEKQIKEYAEMYARNLVLYGVDVRDKLESATSISLALEQAYAKGRSDECKRFESAMAELQTYRSLGTVEELLKKAREKQPKTDWIPFEQREADEEEKAHFLEHYGYELEYMLCGRLPDEDEEILVTYSNGCVGEDIFLRDGTECYLDSGQEIVTEAIAWMPKPQSYKKEGAGDD